MGNISSRIIEQKEKEIKDLIDSKEALATQMAKKIDNMVTVAEQTSAATKK